MPLNESESAGSGVIPPEGKKARGEALASAPGLVMGPVQDGIRQHAQECYPNECCGFVIRAGKRQRVFRVRNISPKPAQYFIGHPEDVEAAHNAGEILFAYHSHPDASPEPTDADKTDAERNEIPHWIVSWPNDEWAFYQPSGWKAPLLGRPFIHGVLDCWELTRDVYAANGILLPQFYRADDWWKKGGNLYLDNFEACGFRMTNEPLQRLDALLMQIGDTPVPNHSAVYISSGMIIHHVQDRISCEQPYYANAGYYAKVTYCRLRHETLL